MSQRLLFVEASPEVREAAPRIIGRIVPCDFAATHDEALALIVAHRYAVVVTPYELPLPVGDARPIVIAITPDGVQSSFDPAVVAMVVPRSYDASTLVGVVLACVSRFMPPDPGGETIGESPVR